MKYPFPIFIFFVFLISCGKEEASKNSFKDSTNASATTVRIAPVGHQNLTLSIQTTGIVSSDSEVKPAFKTGGVVAKMFAEEGDLVKAGQLLAKLDLTEINAQVQLAEEAVNKAKRDLQRVENLYADSVATLENVQDTRTGLRVAEENLRMANFNQDYSEIRSPIAGKVIKKLVNVGEIVGPGMPAYFILGNKDSDWVIKTGLADRDWARVNIGDRATVTFDAYPGKNYEATVTQLADTGNPESGTFDVELSLKNSAPRLAAGLVAVLEIFPKSTANQTVIPLDALVETNRSTAKVFTVANNKAKILEVQIAFLYEDQVVISSGLENVEYVVTDGAPYLFDGAVVDIVD